VEKAIKEIVSDLPQQVRDLVKIDAQKAGNVNIHSVDVEHVFDDKARDIFGNEPLHFAVRSNAVFLAVGAGSLAALKQALAVQPGTAAMVRVDAAVSRLIPLMAKDQPAAPNAAKEAFGKNAGDDRVRFSISGGKALTTEVHLNPAVLKFFVLVGEAGKNTSRK
jgi:hypothetical protein